MSENILFAEIRDNLIFPTSPFHSENERSRIDFFNNLKLLLLDAISSPSISSNIAYLNAFLGNNLKNGRDSAISLLRTLTNQQKLILQKGTDVVLSFLKTNHSDEKNKIYWAEFILEWLSEESRIYRELPKYFNSLNIIPKTNILDAIALKFNRESPQDLEWLVDNISDKNWYDFEYGILITVLESRNYYLLSPDAYRLLIPAFIKEMKKLLSTATNGFFYINLLDLDNFLTYLNPVDARKLELLCEEQKKYIGRYLILIKKLFEIIDDIEGIKDLMSNIYWKSYIDD